MVSPWGRHIPIGKEVMTMAKSGSERSQADLDNHANQLNSNNDAYWQGRGYEQRPDDWESRESQDSAESDSDR